ncbi:MAG: BCCT family transporter [Ornithinimicrobium sp.]
MDTRADGATTEKAPLGLVFFASCVLSAAFVVLGLLFPGGLNEVLTTVREVVVGTVGPAYPVVVTGLLAVVLVLWLSPFGRLRLGGLESRPEFGMLSWVAMLLSAGVGLSFFFWGMAEPLIHLDDPPYGGTDSGSAEAARVAMRYSFLFWGPHAWAIYAVVAISIGYSSYTRNRPMLVSEALRPVLGRHSDGRVGDVVDVLAVIAILFGVATSLGLGTGELNAGLTEVFGIPDSYTTKIVIIVSLMTVSTISAMTGLGRGIRWLSLANIAICAALVCYILILGPTTAIFQTMTGGLADFAGSWCR